MTAPLSHRLHSDPRIAWAAYVLLGVLLAVLPFVVDWGMGRTWVRILDFALLYVMLALGLNIVVGFAGLLDLGYVAFYAVGAYFYAILASPHFDIHLPFWLLLPGGALIACVFGVLLGAPTLRLRGDYLAIVTLGFGEIIRIFLNNLNAPINVTNGPQGINRSTRSASRASRSTPRSRSSATACRGRTPTTTCSLP
jgi:branched-chain amino acid transport system permease protein